MKIFIDLLIAAFIMTSLVLAVFYKNIKVKNSSNFQLLFIGFAILLMSINTISLFYKIACIIIGLYNVVFSLVKIIKSRNEIVINRKE